MSIAWALAAKAMPICVLATLVLLWSRALVNQYTWGAAHRASDIAAQLKPVRR